MSAEKLARSMALYQQAADCYPGSGKARNQLAVVSARAIVLPTAAHVYLRLGSISNKVAKLCGFEFEAAYQVRGSASE